MTVTVRPETASAPPRPAAEESPSPPGPRWRGWLAAYWIPAIALAGLALHFLLRLAPGWQNWPLLAVILAAGLVLAAMTLGAMLASSALADGGSSPITFNLGAVTLNRQRAVVIAGTLTCVRPAEATLSASVSEAVHRHQVTGSNAADFACPAPAAAA